MTLPRAIIVMGVSGAGKSTLAHALAGATGYRFIEGDSLHPAANVDKMASGVPLDDADRWPWLGQVADTLSAAARADGAIISCSALRRPYRDLLRARVTEPMAMIYLQLSRTSLLDRLAGRQGHYMPPSLLDSQIQTLDPPEPDEAIIVLDGMLATDMQVARAIEMLARA